MIKMRPKTIRLWCSALLPAGLVVSAFESMVSWGTAFGNDGAFRSREEVRSCTPKCSKESWERAVGSNCCK